MKVGTISLNINAPDFNYGAILHSWAFQQFLKKQKDVEYEEIIDYTMPRLEGQNLKYPVWSNIKQGHPRAAVKYAIRHKAYVSRYQKFKNFIQNNLCKSSVEYTQKTLNEAKLDYDCVICESDVIWSPGFCGGHFDKSFFLASDSMKKLKRIAYAPSMANGDLSSEQENELRELLKSLDGISCRESYEKAILEKFTEKTVTHVLDPVMLLEAEEYTAICAKRMVPQAYLLLYLPVDDNVNLRKAATKYAQKHGLKILEVSTKLKNYKNSEMECIGDAGVEEFLSAIKYADVVFTNSFHAICFSIIFQVQFYGFSRAYAGKVEDICKTFGLERRYFRNDMFVEKKEIDYIAVDERLQQKKEDSMKWIKNALGGAN